jgi:hypothetical protein
MHAAFPLAYLFFRFISKFILLSRLSRSALPEVSFHLKNVEGTFSENKSTV